MIGKVLLCDVSKQQIVAETRNWRKQKQKKTPHVAGLVQAGSSGLFKRVFKNDVWVGLRENNDGTGFEFVINACVTGLAHNNFSAIAEV